VDLSIIYVNWNSADYLRECIPSIYEHTRGISFEIIVVDNASPAGDIGALKREFPSIILIRSAVNLGFAGANNLGVEHARGACVLFLNPDTRLIGPALTTMLQALSSLPDAGVVGCKLLNRDLSVQTSCIMQYPAILHQFCEMECLRLRWPGFWGIGPLFRDDPLPAKVHAISGACMLMRRDVFEKVGRFSEDYFMYAEDLDLCFKTQRSGFSNYYVGKAQIIHYAGVCSAPEWQRMMKVRSELHFCVKNYGRLYAVLYRIAAAGNSIARLLATTLLSHLGSNIKRRAQFKSAQQKWLSTLKVLLTPSSSQGKVVLSQKRTIDCCDLMT